MATVLQPSSPVVVESLSDRPSRATKASSPLDVDDLKDLMQSVAETTQRLQATHVALREQVSRLQTELEEANSQLRRTRSLAALGEMAAGIAHEVRNPLGSIQLYVQALAEDLVDRPEQARLCEKIDRAVVGLDAIVRDVLQFAREMRVTPVQTAASDLISRSLTSCDGLMNGRDLVVRTVLPQEIELRADVCLMTQALGNVIRNAVEAMSLCSPPAGSETGMHELILSASLRRVRCPGTGGGMLQKRVVFTIDDTGGGIAPDVVKRMFNPFFTTRKTGTGLGLAIVHRIIDAHGGHINVRNRRATDGVAEHHGKSIGTRFELCLPTGERTAALEETT